MIEVTKPNGIFVLDKPAGLSSRSAVDFVQRMYPRHTRIGHAGTLDPLATGVLIVCVGKATKLVEQIQAQSKTYITTIRLGATSDTDDARGAVSINTQAIAPTLEAIQHMLPQFMGTIEQLPPAFSALKVGGQRAYKRARHGKEVVLASRPVRVDAIRLLKYVWPRVELEIDCGKGTYIRSIARDLGNALGVGGYVDALRRTRVGNFHVENAHCVDTLKHEDILEGIVTDGPGSAPK